MNARHDTPATPVRPVAHPLPWPIFDIQVSLEIQLAHDADLLVLERDSFLLANIAQGIGRSA